MRYYKGLLTSFNGVWSAFDWNVYYTNYGNIDSREVKWDSWFYRISGNNRLFNISLLPRTLEKINKIWDISLFVKVQEIFDYFDLTAI